MRLEPIEIMAAPGTSKPTNERVVEQEQGYVHSNSHTIEDFALKAGALIYNEVLN